MKLTAAVMTCRSFRSISSIEVFAVDGGSDDGTIDYLESQGIRVIRSRCGDITKPIYAHFENCTSDALVVFHPKGSIVDPRSVLEFRALVREGYDLSWRAG